MASIEYQEATRIYPGAAAPAVDRLSLQVPDGELLTMVGPSGSGKSTALRMVAGLEEVDEGAILIGGREVTNLAPRERDVAVVFQNYALYPHMSVGENIGFALKLAGRAQAEIDRKVRAAAGLLDLAEFLDRRPSTLSGGQRQRVAMGRAIVRDPAVLLMDEPLSNLEPRLRTETRSQIAALQARLGTTTVYVTHDQVEALTMGDRVAVLNEGVLQQVDSPRALYDRPDTVFVAGFIGTPPMNLLTAPITPNGVQVGRFEIPLPAEVIRAAVSADVTTLTLGLRPESLMVSSAEGGLPLRVERLERVRGDAFVHGRLIEVGSREELVARAPTDIRSRPGDVVTLTVPARGGHAFHPVSGRRLG